MSDEEAKAKAAAAAGPAAGKTIFQKIIDREIPADIIYEDDHVSLILNIKRSTRFIIIFHLGCYPKVLMELIHKTSSMNWSIVVNMVQGPNHLHMGPKLPSNCEWANLMNKQDLFSFILLFCELNKVKSLSTRV